MSSNSSVSYSTYSDLVSTEVVAASSVTAMDSSASMSVTSTDTKHDTKHDSTKHDSTSTRHDSTSTHSETSSKRESSKNAAPGMVANPVSMKYGIAMVAAVAASFFLGSSL